MSDLRDAARQALEALDGLSEPYYVLKAQDALRAALEQPGQEKQMPITDDHGQAIKPQYRVIKAIGKWRLLYDQICVGEAVRHEFRITKTTHDIALYPGISLEDAIKRFDEKVEADHE